ncbi:hypothetical protein AB0M80_43805 [Amycolatopsis sp. NPDC051045]|uniref:hypothetical protein n=1 Tax=Amycolatopsis sp. NPDC051045 TaxID=3156922 RepID=UPI00343108E3
MTRLRGSPAVAAEPFALTGQERHQAARLVASTSHDAADCELLLAMLGLTPADGLAAPDDRPGHRPEETPKPLVRWHRAAQPRRR